MVEELGITTGQALIERFSFEVKKSSVITKDTRREWFKQADGTVQLFNEMVEGFELLRAAALAIVQDNWEGIDIADRAEFGYWFRTYAMKRCPALEWTTIENHIRAARTFILDGFRPAGKVEVIKRNKDKSPVMQNGIIQTEFVDFDPLKVPISKLVLICSAAKKGKIDNNPALWSKVCDDGCTFQDVRSELFSEASKQAKIDPEIKFKLIGPVLIAERNVDEEVILVDDEGFKWEAYYNDTHKDHELTKDALDRLFLVLNVKPDEEILSAVLSRRLVAQQTREERRIR